MPDPLMLAGARPAQFRTANDDAVELVGRSTAIARVQEIVRRAAGNDAGTLITAEAGSAPESVARDLHARSGRAGQPFVVIECTGVDPGAVERLLFGPPPATAPTDLEWVTADSRIAAAMGGTLFLEDV